MNEERKEKEQKGVDGAGGAKEKQKRPPPKGLGAQAQSERREFRKFRPRPLRKPKVEKKEKEEDGGEKSAEQEEQAGGAVAERRERRPRVRVCRYWKAGDCPAGENCKFKHPSKSDAPVLPEGVSIVQPPTALLPPRPQPVIPKKVTIPAASEGGDEQKKMRDSELHYFKRRFAGCKLVEDGADTVIRFKYEIQDPEWPFDVAVMQLCFSIGPAHPVSAPSAVPLFEENHRLPQILTKHAAAATNQAIQDHWKQYQRTDAYENCGKWLVRWIDRNILNIFVEGLKKTKMVMEAQAAGIVLVMPDKDQTEEAGEEKQGGDGEEEEEEEEGEDLAANVFLSTPGGDALACQLAAVQLEGEATEALDPHLPIEVVVVWNNASGNIASLEPTSLHVSVTCSRCGADTDHDVPANDRPIGWRCPRCTTAESLRLKPLLVHETSPVLAGLDARGCKPVDCNLLASSLKFACLACNKVDDVHKLNYGACHKSWCRGCHTLCEFTIQSIRFRGDFSRVKGEDRDAAARLPKCRARKEDKQRVSIIDGQPLPAQGTCQHYKKSYRWFRFPCCGKVYPCDVCHDEKEAADHEMKFANRMICGFCSREQPFHKDKPCVNCQESVTRIKSQFWEGGKGCRDQKHMSKNDSRKYTGSRMKTIPKKRTGQLFKKDTTKIVVGGVSK